MLCNTLWFILQIVTWESNSSVRPRTFRSNVFRNQYDGYFAGWYHSRREKKSVDKEGIHKVPVQRLCYPTLFFLFIVNISRDTYLKKHNRKNCSRKFIKKKEKKKDCLLIQIMYNHITNLQNNVLPTISPKTTASSKKKKLWRQKKTFFRT